MKKDIKDMSIEEIFNKVGKILTPENVFYILKADYDGNEYEEFYLKIKNNPKKGREQLYQYCGLDTYAEYVLYHYLLDVVANQISWGYSQENGGEFGGVTH